MSRKQRREHRAVEGETRQGITLCAICGQRLRYINTYTTYRHETGGNRAEAHWRHWRR